VQAAVAVTISLTYGPDSAMHVVFDAKGVDLGRGLAFCQCEGGKQTEGVRRRPTSLSLLVP
jgi:hypothetical protein